MEDKKQEALFIIGPEIEVNSYQSQEKYQQINPKHIETMLNISRKTDFSPPKVVLQAK